MFPPCTKSQDGKHNFAVTDGDCANGCGMNQAFLSGKSFKKPAMKSVGMFDMSRFTEPKKQPKGIHSELHDLIAQMITEYGEPKEIRFGNGKAVSTFGYYLGRLKKVPISKIYQWRAEIRDSRDIHTPGKIFWWKYKQWWKDQPKKSQKKKDIPPAPP